MLNKITTMSQNIVLYFQCILSKVYSSCLQIIFNLEHLGSASTQTTDIPNYFVYIYIYMHTYHMHVYSMYYNYNWNPPYILKLAFDKWLKLTIYVKSVLILLRECEIPKCFGRHHQMHTYWWFLIPCFCTSFFLFSTKLLL